MVRDAKPFLNHVPVSQTIRIWVPVLITIRSEAESLMCIHTHTYTHVFVSGIWPYAMMGAG